MQLTQTLSIGSTKLSVLLFYLRLFGRPSQTFRAINALMMLFALGWTVSFFFASVFMCNPVNSEIIPDPPDTFTCIDETKMFLAQAYSGVVLDVFILSLPLPMGMLLFCLKIRMYSYIDSAQFIGCIVPGPKSLEFSPCFFSALCKSNLRPIVHYVYLVSHPKNHCCKYHKNAISVCRYQSL